MVPLLLGRASVAPLGSTTEIRLRGQKQGQAHHGGHVVAPGLGLDAIGGVVDSPRDLDGAVVHVVEAVEGRETQGCVTPPLLMAPKGAPLAPFLFSSSLDGSQERLGVEEPDTCPRGTEERRLV